MSYLIVCEKCGGQNVVKDAWVSFNPFSQFWEIENIYDNAYCLDCENETQALEKPIELTEDKE